MSDEQKMFKPTAEASSRAWIKNMEQYQEMYDRSIKDPEGFWGEIAEEFHWTKKWDKVWDYNFNMDNGPIRVEWFKGAKTNITTNCLDRHLETRGDQTAIIWEGNDEGEDAKFTYKQVHAEVCKFANVLKAHGVKKGDAVTIYMPMVPELAFAMLACARIGAMHSIIFGGFSPDSIADRVGDCKGTIILTTDGVYRGKKPINLKANVDKAIETLKGQGHEVTKVICSKRLGEGHGVDAVMVEGRDFWLHDEMAKVDANCEPEEMDAEDPLFILYTSGSTGKPKGVLHTTGGYMVYTATTHKYIFDYQDGDMYWCTADIGWVTGHSYIIYGPLANGATTIMFEGVPNHPTPDRFWKVVDKYKVNQFYTAPTAIRAIAAAGEEWPAKCDLSSLRLLGTVGEPINPEAWMWYHRNIGHEKCPIVDTWWQTETGGILITPLPGCTPTKPGAATLPFFGCNPVVVDDQGKKLDGPAFGLLMIDRPWPGMMRTVYGDHDRFEQTYFSAFRGYYMTGDGCRRDEDGYYWITGRVDDVINVSGHRMGTAEVESALVSHDKVAESAVVGFPHDIKGQGIYAYVTLNTGEEYTDELKKELIGHVRNEIGPIAAPDVIHWAPGLPKTRSGKIMRRILRKIAANEADQLGDTTTLADPSVVDNLVKSYVPFGKK